MSDTYVARIVDRIVGHEERDLPEGAILDYDSSPENSSFARAEAALEPKKRRSSVRAVERILDDSLAKLQATHRADPKETEIASLENSSLAIGQASAVPKKRRSSVRAVERILDDSLAKVHVIHRAEPKETDMKSRLADV